MALLQEGPVRIRIPAHLRGGPEARQERRRPVSPRHGAGQDGEEEGGGAGTERRPVPRSGLPASRRGEEDSREPQGDRTCPGISAVVGRPRGPVCFAEEVPRGGGEA